MRAVLKKFENKMMEERYSASTIKTYINALKKFYRVTKRPFSKVTEDILEKYVHENFNTASTANIFLCALNCYHKYHDNTYHSLLIRNKYIRDVKYIPIDEVSDVLLSIQGIDNRLIARVMYGCGYKLMEALNIRINHVNTNSRAISYRRRVPIPKCLCNDLQAKVYQVQMDYYKDIREGNGYVHKTYRRREKRVLTRKRGWQFLFPAKKISYKKSVKHNIRDHYNHETFQKALKKATNGKYSHESLRHSYGIHMLQLGHSSTMVKELMGCRNNAFIDIYKVHAKNSDIRYKSKYKYPLNYVESKYGKD